MLGLPFIYPHNEVGIAELVDLGRFALGSLVDARCFRWLPNIKLSKIGPSDIGPSDIGLSKIGPSKIGPDKIGPSKIGLSKIGLSDISRRLWW